MVKTALASLLLIFSIVPILGFVKARVPLRKYIVTHAVDVPINMGEYCDGKTTVLVNSGSGSTVFVLPTSPDPGTRCSAAILVSTAATFTATEDFYGSDGSVINYFQVASGSSTGCFISAVAIDSSHWTIDELYGAWVGVP